MLCLYLTHGSKCSLHLKLNCTYSCVSWVYLYHIDRQVYHLLATFCLSHHVPCIRHRLIKRHCSFFFRSTYCPKYPLCQILILLVIENYYRYLLYRYLLEFHFYTESNAFLFKGMGHPLTLEPLITESHKRFSTTTRFLKRLQSHAESTLSSNSGRIH